MKRHLGSITFSIAIALAVAAAWPGSGQVTSTGQHWVGTWSTAVQQSGPNARTVATFSTSGKQTLREIVHISIGGSQVRIRLANTFGSQLLELGAVYVGQQQEGARLMPGSNHEVTFGGNKQVSIPAGALALSDPISMTVGSEQNLAISLYLSSQVNPVTEHGMALTTNFVATGDEAKTESGDAFQTKLASWVFLSGVDVLAAPQVKGAVVALGDSITDGAASKPNENGRWPDVLARRLLAAPPQDWMGVLNEGISGNNVLTSTPCFGEDAVARIDRDVIAQTGARDVIVLEGINDISQPDFAKTGKLPSGALVCMSQREVSAEQIIAGYKQIIAQSHAAGLKVFGATLTPYKGFAGWTEEGEAKRDAINKWMLTSGAYDGVIDFAKAVADPNDPLRFAAQYDSGDHLHPNTAGLEAMAKAIPLNLLQ